MVLKAGALLASARNVGPRLCWFGELGVALLDPSGAQDTVDDIMSIFELFDYDSTGTISFDNLQNVARVIGAKESATKIQEMLNTLDTDGDNELDPIDFYTCLISGMRIRLDEEPGGPAGFGRGS